ncbi:unnamed protein product [Gongylonema pulchrum]|uniref:DUF2179 domain-containing protein n=1 Tax=Gongylonema pulchrum TaxID=637853 RepID=A0A183CZ66_9BILA|nr:unnamed protein product [Gongylonema pulchrum]
MYVDWLVNMVLSAHASVHDYGAITARGDIVPVAYRSFRGIQMPSVLEALRGCGWRLLLTKETVEAIVYRRFPGQLNADLRELAIGSRMVIGSPSDYGIKRGF